jgi:hypothetical protein
MYLFLTNPVIGGLASETPVSFFGKLFSMLMAIGFFVGLVVFAFFFIRGAIMWITAGSDKAQLQAAQSSLITAVIGLTLLLGIVGIIDLLEKFFGVRVTFFNIGRLRI